MARTPRELEPADYGTPESFERGAKVFVLRDAKSGHAVNAKTLSYLERMEREGFIEPKQREAGEQFNYHFNRAGLERYATINLFRVLGGVGEAAEAAIFHRQKIRLVMDTIGGLQASVIWHVCGAERPLADWLRDRKAAGMKINDQIAKGILLAALDSLVKHYGK